MNLGFKKADTMMIMKAWVCVINKFVEHAKLNDEDKKWKGISEKEMITDFLKSFASKLTIFISVESFVVQSLSFLLEDYEQYKGKIKEIYDLYAKDGKMKLTSLKKFLYDCKVPVLSNKQQIERMLKTYEKGEG
jgi:hypothetical protein